MPVSPLPSLAVAVPVPVVERVRNEPARDVALRKRPADRVDDMIGTFGYAYRRDEGDPRFGIALA